LEVGALFALLVLLLIKHLFADFFLQTPIMLGNRAQYIHVGRVLHCGVHVLGTVIAFVLVGVPLGALVALLVAEFLAHFHIDFAKGWWSERLGHTPDDASYWRAFGVDQLLHQLTYVLMVWVLI